ncbi:MAG: M16 family metallopeptidase, partial [Candidatus Latescibacterota bacterium]
MQRSFIIITAVAALALGGCASRNETTKGAEGAAGSPLSLNTRLPIAPEVKVGKLDNGVTYYIRRNVKPENRAELRLVVNAGSVLENENQRGVAHFNEHMAFNGTEHFEEHELVNFLESIGMRFGPDLNAYTSFDETVYMLQVPTDSVKTVETAFQILEDWAHLVSYQTEEIEKERGVVIEEWRLGRGAEMRMLDKQLPIILKDSRYAERLPIGKVEVLKSAPPEVFRDFYKTWYRPELMAVVAVGDFDPQRIESLIQKHFSGIKPEKDAPERTLYPVPDNEETLFAIATDPEATRASVDVYFKRDAEKMETVQDYRQSIVEGLYNAMFNQRLNELAREADPPFLYGYSSLGDLVRTKEVYVLGAGVRENGIERGLEAVLTEAARVKRHGFTRSELDRQKEETLRGMEQIYNERDKLESSRFAEEFAEHYLTGEPIPGIEYEYELYRKYIPEVTLDEVNRLAGELITERNRVVTVDAPEKAGVKVPGAGELRAIFDRVARKEILAYQDTVSAGPLVEREPNPSKVSNEKSLSEIGVTEWRLANGVRVVLKPTDFKNDQVLFSAYSPGGASLAADSLYVPAITATSIVEESGAGRFTQTELIKKLAGKIVEASPWISELQEGFSGSASPQDMETMFQLIYLYFTQPRADSAAYHSVLSRLKGSIENRSARPETAFSDTISATMGRYHYRVLPWTIDRLREMDLRESFDFYRERFSDAGDFTFFFVGNFELETIRPLVEKWLGGLPSTPREESWRDTGVRPPAGVVRKDVRKGIEPKSLTQVVFTGPFEWNRRNRYVIDSLAGVLRIRLREVLREDLGGTYGVSVSASTEEYPRETYRFSLGFGSSPERVDELMASVFAQIDSLQTQGAGESYLAKVKEMQIRSRETSLKENGFWLGSLQAYYFHNENPLEILDYGKLVQSLSSNDIRQAAQKYLNEKNYVRVTLSPEMQAAPTRG